MDIWNNFNIKLLKESKFMNSENKTITILNQDCNLILKNRIKIKCGDSYIVYGEKLNEFTSESDIEIISPIINYNGFGIKTIGIYDILLTNESKIRIFKDQQVNIIGPKNKLYLVTLDEDLDGCFVEIYDEKKEIIKNLNEEKIKIDLEINKLKENIENKIKILQKSEQKDEQKSEPKSERVILSAPAGKTIILTKELLSSLSN
jgi:hypothetical protein